MNPNAALRIFYRIVFAIIGLVSFVLHRDFKKAVTIDGPIEYRYIRKIDKSKGRSDMFVKYNDKQFKVAITDRIYDEIEEGRFPLLYYSTAFNLVFSEWGVVVTRRLFITFSIGFLLTFFPARWLEKGK